MNTVQRSQRRRNNDWLVLTIAATSTLHQYDQYRNRSESAHIVRLALGGLVSRQVLFARPPSIHAQPSLLPEKDKRAAQSSN
jgi:hypothetical protein